MTLHAGRYGAATAATGTPRAVEYQVFSQVTGRLNRARAPDRPFAELAAALNENLSLWKTLACDLASDGNSLPVELRASLLGLARFTEEHTARVLRREESAKVLVEINTAVMRGLRGVPGDA